MDAFKCTETSVEAKPEDSSRSPLFIDAYDWDGSLTKAQAEHYQKYHADQERLSGE